MIVRLLADGYTRPAVIVPIYLSEEPEFPGAPLPLETFEEWL